MNLKFLPFTKPWVIGDNEQKPVQRHHDQKNNWCEKADEIYWDHKFLPTSRMNHFRIMIFKSIVHDTNFGSGHVANLRVEIGLYPKVIFDTFFGKTKKWNFYGMITKLNRQFFNFFIQTLKLRNFSGSFQFS